MININIVEFCCELYSLEMSRTGVYNCTHWRIYENTINCCDKYYLITKIFYVFVYYCCAWSSICLLSE